MSDIRTPPQGEHDAEFDAFLREQEAQLAPVYRKLPQPQPSAALDARIRERALRALHDGAANTPQRTAAAPARARRWLPAFGAAAAMVLVAGLAWRLLPPHAQSETAALPSATEPAAAPTSALESAATGTPTLNAQSAPASADRRDVAAMAPAPANGHAAAKSAPKATAPTPPPHAMDRALPLARTASAREESPRAESDAFPAAPARAVAPAQTEVLPATTSASTESASALVAPQAAPDAPVAQSDMALARRAPLPAAVPRPAQIERDPDQPQRYRWSVSASAPSSASATSGIYPPEAPPVDIWLAIVRAMRDDARIDDAKRALRDLRRQHPHAPVPSDLRDLE